MFRIYANLENFMSEMPTLEELKLQYQDHSSRADRLRVALVEQLNRLIEANKLSLGVPVESRVKAWVSLEEKLGRKSSDLNHITDLDDLVGIRIILLFKKDLLITGELIEKTFKLISKEDASSRLADGQFGYQSQHYLISVPAAWAGVPTFADLEGLKVEVQVRTLAQHMWAAVSHKLQYKQEKSVPPPLRRAIYRASALLETVDLEFERFLEEREAYINKNIDLEGSSEPLNVDLLAATLNRILPEANRVSGEEYDELLLELLHFNVFNVDDLEALLKRHLKEVLAEDAEKAAKSYSEQTFSSLPEDLRTRFSQGIFWAHSGLTRRALAHEFTESWDEYKKKSEDKPPNKI